MTTHVTAPDLDGLDLAGLASALHAAFDDGSLRLYFQPEVDLRNGSVPGMEAYPYWASADAGLLGPAALARIAEAAGLADRLGAWVLQSAVAEARSWHAMSAGTPIRPPRLWVNVDACQLAGSSFAWDVERLVRVRALPPGAVGLEFAEETLGLAHRRVPRLLARLRAVGVAIGVDGFGTWYGSLSTLDVLPLDLVRIDGRFLQATLRDLEGEAVLASIVSVAHRRRMTVVAEQVDGAALLVRVAAMGADRASGAVFCPPVPAEDARLIVLGRGRPQPPHQPQPQRRPPPQPRPDRGDFPAQRHGPLTRPRIVRDDAG
jgi:EAL domain-containing protein (putative c-di-GMP-specific phosphodiesterase class I)